MEEYRHQASHSLLAARAGSNEALGQLLDACRLYLLRIAEQEIDPDLRAKGGASDLVQLTFLEAQRHFTHFHGDTEGELKAWLRRLLVDNLGHFTRHYRDTAKRQVGREVALQAGSSAGSPGEGLYAATPSPSAEAMAHEQTAALDRALQRLPEDYRRVITLRNLEERSFEEIGPLMQRSPEAVRKLWTRALDRLRQELGQPP
jgi:RNA polymerase sigma-70 factor (ECF subfamily)